MTLPIRTLPLVERWDCHSCGLCCRGSIIALNDDDRERLRRHAWHEHEEFRGVRIVMRRGWLRKRYRLAQRSDGSCVFLTGEGRCRIHEEHGPEAKPVVCRMFPFQLVPLEQFAYLTVRRSCPSAAADRGRAVEEHRPSVRDLAEKGQMGARAAEPPTVTPGHRRSWKDTLRVTDAIERLMLDGRYPLVRRLVHALQFCGLLELCRLRRLDSQRFGELVTMLHASAVEEAGEVFGDRKPPGRAAGLLFRQTALDYVRLHDKLGIRESWRERLRWFRTGIAFFRGKGDVPRLHPDLPETTFEDLQRPLGHLPQDVLRPLDAYFEAAAASKHYALLGRRGWSIVESFRGLALGFSVALWTLRLVCGQRTPEVEDVIDVVGVIDRGQGYAPLAGRRHRRRIARLAAVGEPARLIAWYAR